MAKRLDVTFSVQGWVKQEIEVADGVDPIHVAAMLESGEAFTTIQNGGEVITIADGHVITLGTVVGSDPDLEYFDFELNQTWTE